MTTQVQNENGEWVEATPEPYYPTFMDRVYIFRKRLLTKIDRVFGTNLVSKLLKADDFLDSLNERYE